MSQKNNGAGILCLIGSGEMSPAMVPLHAGLMARAGSPPAPAVLLDSTYGFQDNADELSQKIQRYFRTRVRHPIEVVSLRDLDAAEPSMLERAYQQVRGAQYIFAGPGSPSYAMRQWHRSMIPDLLGEHLAGGACICFASAAAITIGPLALPVYEIYKVGEPAHWIEGINLLEPFGLDLVIVPHYDNTEGGSHDTRFCYVGERRFKQLERQLPPGITVFGIAENTAAIFDLAADTLEVHGRGFAALRRDGAERRFEPGTVVALDQLRSKERPVVSSPAAESKREPVQAAASDTNRFNKQFVAAVQSGRFDDAVVALLGLDDWLLEAAELSVDRQALDQARAAYRSMLVQLGEAAQQHSVAREPLTQIVEIAVRLRDEARGDRRYSEADRLREALLDLGVEVRDTGVGPQWSARQ